MPVPAPSNDLSSATLVYVAPRAGTSGVGDYADDLLELARGRFGTVVEVRHGGAGEDSVRDVLRSRRAIRRAVREAAGPVVLHSEQSGGALVPFWGVMGVRAIVRSATVHDAPLSVWQPFRTRLTGRSKLLVAAMHFPILPLLHRLERRTMRGALLFLLTRSGAAATRLTMAESQVVETFHPVPERPSITPAEQRPLAIGLFGYVYKGKGFERLVELRAALDPSIAIRVAGRGTESLEPMEGVEVLGAVEGRAEDDFFASVRLLVLPYGRRNSYGPATHVASGTIARAIAYQTPVVAIRFAGVDDEMMVVDEFVGLAAIIGNVVGDTSALIALRRALADLSAERSTREAFERYATTWQQALWPGVPGEVQAEADVPTAVMAGAR